MRLRLFFTINLTFFLVTACIYAANPLRVYHAIPRLPTLAASEQPEANHDNSGTHMHDKFIPQFGEVSPTLFRGGQPKKGGFEELAKMGIRIVVDLRGDRKSEREEVTRLGMQYVPLHWQCSFPNDGIFASFLALVRTNPGKKIFVHCRVGDDRTGMMVAAYRMGDEGWSAESAEKEMINFGFNFVHRHLICPRLEGYEKEFPNRFASRPEFEKLRSAKPSRPAQ